MSDIIKIDEKTYRIEDGMVRFFLLIGEKKALLIDSGMNTPDAKKIAKGCNSTSDNDYMDAESTYKYYNEMMWPDRFAKCIDIKEIFGI